jgi:hypothetical protein
MDKVNNARKLVPGIVHFRLTVGWSDTHRKARETWKATKKAAERTQDKPWLLNSAVI